MWAITPTLAIIYAYLSWAAFCLARIWFFPLQPRRFGFAAAALALLCRRAFFTTYAFIGLFLLDCMARFCFLGMISYGSIRYVAASVTLCTIVALLYLLRGAFFAPARKELLASAAMAATYIYMSTAAPVPELHRALYTGLSLTLLFTVIDITQAAIPRIKAGEHRPTTKINPAIPSPDRLRDEFVFAPPLWDLSAKCRLFEGTRLYVVLMLLLSAELVMEVEGFSLFSWF